MSRAIGPLAVFAIGLFGFLAAAASSMTALQGLAWFAFVGAAGGLIGRRFTLMPALWLGMLAGYPAALALRIFVFLGENQVTVAAVLLALASLGFGLAALSLRAIAARQNVL